MADALTVADSLSAALEEPERAQPPDEPHRGRPWPQAMADGATGIALLHIERARSGHGDWETAHRWMATAGSGELTAAANASLYFGAPAVAFAVNAASASTSSQMRRYRRTLARLDEAVLAVTRMRLAAGHARIDRGEQPQLKEFDLIRGLAGLGAYHLRRHPDHPITVDTLRYLVRLSYPLISPNVPGWWTREAPDGNPSPDFPHGHGNLGVSHGIGSALALLSIAVLEGLPVPGAQDAIHRLCAWTDHWLQCSGTAPWWPGFVVADDHRKQRSAPFSPEGPAPLSPSLRPRPSWCYGVGGTARVQQLAALALADTARQDTAEAAMLSTLRDDAQVERLSETGLCHGLAGLLQAAWRMTRQAHTPALASEIPRLTARLITRPPDPRTDPSLLEGAAGVALALHAVGTGTSPATGWDAVLALA